MNSFCTRVLSAAVFAALSAVPLRAQAPADTLSLAALLAAVEGAPVVAAARLSADAARARARGTGLRPDPEVSAMLWPGSLAVGMGEILMLQATQTLPYPRQLRREREVAEALADAAEAGIALASAERRLAVRLAYYGLYRAQAREALVRSFQRRLEAFAEAAAVRYEVGRGTQGAVLQVQLEAARLDEELLTLATMRHEGLVTLSALLGHPVPEHHHTGDAPPRAVVVLPPVPSVADTALVAWALRQRPELAVLDAEARAVEAEESAARLAFRPEIGVTAGLRVMGGSAEALVAAPGVGAMVRLPLNRDRLAARLDETRLRRAEVAARRTELEAEVQAEVLHQALAARREAETMDLYRRRLLPHAETAVESLLASYTTGQADFLELLDAERTRYALSVAAEEARYRYLVALAMIERAMGDGPETTLPR